MAPPARQRRQEGLDHAVDANKVDGEVAFERRTIAQVVIERHAGVVDEDVQRFDFVNRLLNVRGIGHVQSKGHDAVVGVSQGCARTDVHALCASAQCLLDQRPTDAAIAPGNQNCVVGDSHHDDDLLVDVFDYQCR